MPESSCFSPLDSTKPKNQGASIASAVCNGPKSEPVNEPLAKSVQPFSTNDSPSQKTEPPASSPDSPENLDFTPTPDPSTLPSILNDPKELSAYFQSLGFDLAEELGSGGMGIVYKAKQRDLNRYCALKVIKPDRLDSANLKARFVREVQAAAKLSHPNIVTVFQTNLDGPIPFLAMEYVPGANLLDVIRKNGPIPHANVIQYVRQVADGLQHAFEQGLVHCDIKPANLMITPWPLPVGKRATIKILDMGLARCIDDRGSETIPNRANVLVGTPDYAPPEQAQDFSLVDVRSDLYALGGTMFVLLTGRWMFKATTKLMKKLKKHQIEVPPLVHTIRPGIPPALSAIVAKLLQKKPEDRFQTPQEFIDALDALAELTAASAGRSVSSELMPAISPVPLMGHSGPVYSLAVSADGKQLLSGGSDETCLLWDIESRRPQRLPNKGGSVVAVALSPDGRVAATASARLFDDPNQVDLWENSSGRFVGKLRGMKYPIQCLAFAPDGRKIAAGAEDGAVLVWTFQREAPVLRFAGHKSNVSAISFMKDGKCLLTASHDGSLAIWDVGTAAKIGTMPASVGPIRDIAVSGGRIALAGNELRLLHGDGSFVNFIGNNAPVECVAFSPLRRHILAGGSDGSVRLWQIDKAYPVEELPKHPNRTRAVAFAPNGSTFSAGDDGVIRQCFPKTPGLA